MFLFVFIQVRKTAGFLHMPLHAEKIDSDCGSVTINKIGLELIPVLTHSPREPEHVVW